MPNSITNEPNNVLLGPLAKNGLKPPESKGNLFLVAKCAKIKFKLKSLKPTPSQLKQFPLCSTLSKLFKLCVTGLPNLAPVSPFLLLSDCTYSYISYWLHTSFHRHTTVSSSFEESRHNQTIPIVTNVTK